MAEIVGISSAAGWSVVAEDDGARLPLIAWALVADPRSVPYVVGLVVGEDREQVELAPPGEYRLEDER